MKTLKIKVCILQPRKTTKKGKMKEKTICNNMKEKTIYNSMKEKTFCKTMKITN